MNTFQLKIIASNKVFFDGEAQSLSIPRLNGAAKLILQSMKIVLCLLNSAK